MDELIRRQDAIDVTAKWFEKIGLNGDICLDGLRSLPTVQPTQTNCEYCHTDRDGYVLPLEKNCHAYISRGMHGWVIELKAKGWRGEAKIKYCPICGRRLTDGTD